MTTFDIFYIKNNGGRCITEIVAGNIDKAYEKFYKQYPDAIITSIEI